LGVAAERETKIFTIAEVAERLNVSTRPFRRWIEHAGLGARRFGAVAALPGPSMGIAADMSSLTINGTTRTKSAAVSAFLLEVLAGREVEVAVLESRARTAGLLTERQKIEDSKLFKTAKRKLGVRSRRVGFGVNGRWFWRLETPREVEAQRPTILPGSRGIQGTYLADRPQSERPSSASLDQSVKERSFPAEWMDGLIMLEARPALRDVPAPRRDQLVNDYRLFLSSQWAARADKLGWGSSDLFACCPLRPLDYLASAGLLWHMGGGNLTQLTKDWALILRPNGAEHAFNRHRRPLAIATTVPWLLP
jgi:hypothetical protein